MTSTTINHINRELAEQCVKDIAAIHAALEFAAAQDEADEAESA